MNLSQPLHTFDIARSFALRMWRKTVTITVVVAGAGVVLVAQPAAAQATYHYTGHAFDAFSCGPTSDNSGTLVCPTPAPTNTFTSYNGGNLVSATLTFSTALASNLSLQDVSTQPGFQLSMTDGLQTVSSASAAGLIAEVSTDGNGQISSWRLVINTGGVNNGGIFTINETSAQDAGTLACCDPEISGNFGEVFNSPGTWSSANVVCTVQTNQHTYVNGDSVIAQVFRFTNTGSTPTAVELKFWLQLPGAIAIPLIRAGADGSLVLPASVNVNAGPLTLLPVSAAVPRGSYAIGCRFVNPITGQLQSESLAPFIIQ